MTKLFSTAAVAAGLLAAASATPLVAREDVQVTPMDEMVGFDESHIKVYLAGETPLIPEIKTLTQEDLDAVADSEASPLVLDPEELEKRYINGPDNRYQFTSRDYPFVTTGKLFYDNGAYCSGALVGPRHVLTAAHCLQDGVPGYFSPGWDNGDPLGTGRITTVIRLSGWEWGAGCGWKGDWAVLIIDQRKGDEFGYFGVKYPERSKIGQPIFTHVGYPGDKGGQRPYRQDNTRVLPEREWDCDATGPFYTDNDVAGGQSGGVIWENTGSGPYVWGTLSVTLAVGDLAWAGWASGDQVVGAIVNARNDFP